MPTHLYLLLDRETKPAEPLYPVWGASKHTVRDGDWYAARERCIQHAIESGYNKMVIVVGHVHLYHQPHWNGNGTRFPPSRMTPEAQHGLWLYMDRLLLRFGHVYAPPLAWAKNASPGAHLNAPTIPMVAGYTASALLTLRDRSGPLGKPLCANGYDSFTMTDYFHHNLGPTVYDEPGSHTTWHQAYERSVNRLC